MLVYAYGVWHDTESYSMIVTQIYACIIYVDRDWWCLGAFVIGNHACMVAFAIQKLHFIQQTAICGRLFDVCVCVCCALDARVYALCVRHITRSVRLCRRTAHALQLEYVIIAYGSSVEVASHE